MDQDACWQALLGKGITAIVGAGGKTTILQKLVEQSLALAYPVVMTTTTRMLLSQVAQWDPYIGTYSEALQYCEMRVAHHQCGAWFYGIDHEKVVSVPSEEITAMNRTHPDWSILVEADGAKGKWIKSPKVTEPVIPLSTARTIGVINGAIFGQALTEEIVHNIDLVEAITGIQRQDTITPEGIAALIRHQRGLFQYSRGSKYLVITGCEHADQHMLDTFLRLLRKGPVSKIILGHGYKDQLMLYEVLTCE